MKKKASASMDFRKNLMLYYCAVGVIILGYVFLSIGGANSFTSLTLGPVILVIGYLVAMPVALLCGIGKKESGGDAASAVQEPEKKSRKQVKSE
ncbi:DUF3098 domain-containing protein [bacterium]|nr:DUF3098 domain-containing protein [bacterium]